MKKLVIVLNVASIFARKKKRKFSYLKELDKSYITVNGYMAAYQKLVSVRYPALSDIIDDLKKEYGEIPCVKFDRVLDFRASMTMTKKRSPNVFFISVSGRILIHIVSFEAKKVGYTTQTSMLERTLTLEDALKEFKGKLFGPNSAIYLPAEYKWR